MSSKSIVKLLRKVIREEVRAAVKEALTERKVNHNKVINHGMDLHTLAENPVPAASKKRFTKNDMLNDLLNETAATPPTQELTDWSTMNFKSEMAEQFGTTRQQPLATTGINGEPVNMNNENVAKTVDIMTRDYSGLMKAINKKKGIK
jgi:hypothetical protein